MVSKEFFSALDMLEREKKISKEDFIETLENALTLAYKKQYGNAKNVEVVLVPERSAIRILATLTVVEEVEDPGSQISLEDAKLIDRKYKVGDKIVEEIDSKNFGRLVAQNCQTGHSSEAA